MHNFLWAFHCAQCHIYGLAMSDASHPALDRVHTLLGGPPTAATMAPIEQVSRRRLTRRQWTVVAAIAVGSCAALVWGSTDGVIAPTVVTQPGPLGSHSPLAQDHIVVDVEGDVLRPGLVTLAPGSRVADALAAAGGATKPLQAGSLNLAAKVDDGQLVLVGATTATATDKRVALNSADATALESLPGVGPVLAGRILSWRDQHHRFTSVDQLQEVPGIGAALFGALKPLVRL